VNTRVATIILLTLGFILLCLRECRGATLGFGWSNGMPVLRVFVPRGESATVKYSTDLTNWLSCAWGEIWGDDREHVFTPAQWLTLGAERMFFRLETWGKTKQPIAARRKGNDNGKQQHGT
jgi:hypothetical protein